MRAESSSVQISFKRSQWWGRWYWLCQNTAQREHHISISRAKSSPDGLTISFFWR